MKSIVEILDSLSDDLSIDLFTNPSLEGRNISLKQWYNRMARFKRSGLIEKTNSHYTHTTQGKIVLYLLDTLWKMKQYDSLFKAYDTLVKSGFVNEANLIIENNGLRHIINGDKTNV